MITLHKNLQQFLIPFLVTLAFSSFLAPYSADAYISCQSEKGGHCIRLTKEVPSAQQQFKKERLMLAADPPFPGLEFLEPFGITFKNSDIGDILSSLYVFGISLVGISAFAMFVYGGLLYMTAGDSTGRVSRAKSAMGNALFGLILALTSYLILYTINPEFTFKIQKREISCSGGLTTC